MHSATVQLRNYARTFIALLVLLLLTVGANFLDLGRFSLVVSMLIAVAKALLILLFFMELRYSRKIIWPFAAAGAVWLLLMLLFLFADYATRSWIGSDWRTGTGPTNHVEFAPPR